MWGVCPSNRGHKQYAGSQSAVLLLTSGLSRLLSLSCPLCMSSAGLSPLLPLVSPGRGCGSPPPCPPPVGHLGHTPACPMGRPGLQQSRPLLLCFVKQCLHKTYFSDNNNDRSLKSTTAPTDGYRDEVLVRTGGLVQAWHGGRAVSVCGTLLVQTGPGSQSAVPRGSRPHAPWPGQATASPAPSSTCHVADGRPRRLGERPGRDGQSVTEGIGPM